MKIRTTRIEASSVRLPVTLGSMAAALTPASVGWSSKPGRWNGGPAEPLRSCEYSTTAAPKVATWSRWIVALVGPSLPWNVKSRPPPGWIVTSSRLSRWPAWTAARPAARSGSGLSR